MCLTGGPASLPAMPHHPNEQYEQAVLDLIDHSPNGAVPHTPTYQDALRNLIATFQVYPSSEHAGNFVTTRSLSGRPSFSAENIETLHSQGGDELEANASIFERYVQSLDASLQTKARGLLATVAGRPAKHRAKHGIVTAHDPVHSLFLVPGAGPHPGLPGNYLYGFIAERNLPEAAKDWSLHLHDREDGEAVWHTPDVSEAIDTLRELLSSAPFHLRELETFGFAVS